MSTKIMPASSRPVIITDLDGTLLDHHSYSFAAATKALALIAARNYPLVLNSSKTRAEILALQQQLGFHQPFICENGAAVYLPEGDRWRCQSFADAKTEWLPWVHQLRTQHNFDFAGFTDWTIPQLVEITGLHKQQAALAAKREYSEPLQWYGSEQSRLQFEKLLAEKKMRLVLGGRFYSLQGQFDKAQAMLWLKSHYEQQGPVITIALGDSPNDCAMLNAADIAVVIQSTQSASMHIEGPGKIIRTSLPGPQGWQQAITTIISELDASAATEGGTTHG